ncbi:hypothetical protein [Galbitalea soli]|uniref:Uncharacterized protein n=1 Tax=Galbitalea soli TaxID=1268042 RepID=A0A7C9TQU0_9MICO|nr:hypothetical protein [Galbitalea soli]NEM91696.1 hypothetical protein [Galbitalea soli]NYJ30392.1 TRAP-type mannitol/chloroaromatic compound transport system permease large subunit [Galbitalea soli]
MTQWTPAEIRSRLPRLGYRALTPGLALPVLAGAVILTHGRVSDAQLYATQGDRHLSGNGIAASFALAFLIPVLGWMIVLARRALRSPATQHPRTLDPRLASIYAGVYAALVLWTVLAAALPDLLSATSIALFALLDIAVVVLLVMATVDLFALRLPGEAAAAVDDEGAVDALSALFAPAEPR